MNWFKIAFIAGWLLPLSCVPGCAWLSTSSAARRAGTYVAETTIQIDPRSGKVSASSSGDDIISVDELTVGKNTMKGFTLNFNRSNVVKAQGARAIDITPLLGQDIQLNQVWGDTLIKVAEETNKLVATVGSIAVQMRSTQQQSTQNQTDIQTILQALHGGVPAGLLPPPAPTHPVIDGEPIGVPRSNP